MRNLVSSSVASLFALALLALPLHAQEGRIAGRVTSAEGEPIESVTIQVVGTELGTLTGPDGNFSLRGVPAGQVRVRAGRIGYRQSTKTVQVTAGETSTVNFSLQTSAVELSEVVATVGAGQVTRREIGTSVATLNAAEQVQEAASPNFSRFLNARVANVDIMTASGNVGAGQRITIRGINSLTQSNNPLLIIDGVRVDNSTNTGINRGQTFSRFNDINPQNIADIQVVKGPTATTLYGSEASSGVIIIETKSGSSGRGAQINVEAEAGIMRDMTDYPPTLADVTNMVSGPDDPVLQEWPTFTNPNTGQILLRDNPFEDRETSPLRTGDRSRVNASIRGGAEGVTYFSSLQWEQSQGVLPSNDLNSFNFRANFGATPSSDLSVRVSTGLSHKVTNLPKSGGNTSGFFANAIIGFPTSSKTPDGGPCFANVTVGRAAEFCEQNGNIRASFDNIAEVISRENLDRATMSARLTYTPFDWLNNTVKIGFDEVSQEFKDAIPFDPEVPFSFAAGGENFLSRNQQETRTADVSSRLSFDLTDDLSSRTVGGAQYFMDKFETTRCEGRVFPNAQADACDAAVSIRGFSDEREKVEIGAYLQQRFGWKDYFYATGALRVDDNSSLGRLEDAIWSPSANFSWVISDVPGWDVSWVDQLRLRGAWGKASQSPEQFAAQRTFQISRLDRGGDIKAGLSPEDPGNPNLGAERSEEFEAGVDADLFGGRLGVDFTYFNQTTTDAILSVPVAPSTGFANDKFVNVGELSNDGWEATLTFGVLERENVTWDARLIASNLNPEITKVGIENPPPNVRKGFAPAEYISRLIISAERNEQGEIIPGSIEYAPGTVGDGSGRRGVGQPLPTNTQSLSSTIRLFETVQIHTLFDRQAGHELLADSPDFRCPLVDGAGVFSSTCWRWVHRRQATTPVEQAGMEKDFRVGDHNFVWVEEANFIKFRELRVSYQLPDALLGQFGAASGRFFVTGRNISSWTDWDGIDPETVQEGARDQVETIETGLALPPTQQWSAGLSLSF